MRLSPSCRRKAIDAHREGVFYVLKFEGWDNRSPGGRANPLDLYPFHHPGDNLTANKHAVLLGKCVLLFPLVAADRHKVVRELLDSAQSQIDAGFGISAVSKGFALEPLGRTIRVAFECIVGAIVAKVVDGGRASFRFLLPPLSMQIAESGGRELVKVDKVDCQHPAERAMQPVSDQSERSSTADYAIPMWNWVHLRSEKCWLVRRPRHQRVRDDEHGMFS